MQLKRAVKKAVFAPDLFTLGFPWGSADDSLQGSSFHDRSIESSSSKIAQSWGDRPEQDRKN